ncbi:MAG: mevalonate kinase family protein [Candidatus Heimdallarchaeaceae archaeon]
MFYSSSPARVCLYGEHQDYLQLNVIPAAINLRLSIYSVLSENKGIHITSKDLNKKIAITNSPSSLVSKKGSLKSYLEAGLLSLKRSYSDIICPSLDVTIESQIPIASGLASSAALLVGWIGNLSGILGIELKKNQIAELAYDAEHNVLGVPCGKMDQYACSYGDIIRLSSTEPPKLVQLRKPDIDLIVVDSQTPKFTSDVHGNKVENIKKVVNQFEILTSTKLSEASSDLLNKNQQELTNADFKILKSVISIKEHTEQAEIELSKTLMNIEFLGELLTKQHSALKEGIGVSLPILDKIVQESLNLGALGGKLTGAGLGGSVVIMTKDNTEQVAQGLKQKLNLPVRIVEVDGGVTFKKTE